MRTRRALAPALAAVAFLARPAAASPQARLVYGRAEGADTCPDESALRQAVAARVGYDPFFPTAPRTVVVTISGRGGHLAARVQLIDEESHAQGARTIESTGRDCASLFDTVALTISIAIDPQALAHPSPPPPPPAEPTPAPTPPPSPASAPEPAPLESSPPVVADTPSPDTPKVELGANVRGSLGLAPGPALGLAVAGALAWSRASLGAELSIDLPASKSFPGGESVSSWLAAGTLVPCLRLAPLEVCGLASIGRLEGSGGGVTSPLSPSTLFLAFGGRIGVQVPLTSRFAFVGTADALGNVTRTTLDVAGSPSSWRAPPVGGVLSLGAVVSF